jgi:hypothetical protein
VEPGSIFKTKDGIKMENINEELAESLDYVEVFSLDEEGNVVKTKVY